ncbi:MAG: BrnT family toxin [Candidatus Omnitrophica bacterium]|nr:BrnT family toxin [Candidatus Omnitrophota bacterium]
MNIKFDWDKSKASLNKKKHGVSFEEAMTIFYDDNALEFFDPDHSENKDRFIMLGMSFKARILVVCHCVREEGSLIRIISARKATKHEAKNYKEVRI